MAEQSWGLDPNTISAVATAGATIVALIVGGAAIWQHKRKVRKTKKLAKALFAHEVTELTIAVGMLSHYESRELLATGKLPTARHRKALKLVFIKEHAFKLDLDAPLAEKLALLLNQVEMLNWFVEDVMAETDLNLRRVKTMQVVPQAADALKTAVELLKELHPRNWRTRLKVGAKRLVTARKRQTPVKAPDPLSETIRP